MNKQRGINFNLNEEWIFWDIFWIEPKLRVIARVLGEQAQQAWEHYRVDF